MNKVINLKKPLLAVFFVSDIYQLEAREAVPKERVKVTKA